MNTPIPMLPKHFKRGFTLLEVIVALGILSVGLMVLVDSQATALFMTTDANRLNQATQLANEKMTECLLTLEKDGWGSQDIEEEGDFEDFGEEEFRGEGLHLDLDESLEEYQWAYTIRKIELTLPDMGGMMGDLADSNYFGEEKGEEFDAGGAPDLGDMGVSSDMVTEYLSDYLREVRVLVWWGDNEDGTDQIEIVHHVINPSGMVVETGEDAQ